MFSAIFKHSFSFHALWDSLFKISMSTSFYGQELQRALKEQGPAIQNFLVASAGPLQASARVKLLEGHLICITLTAQGYKIDINSDESAARIYETVEDLLHSASPLYAQRRSEALFEALKRLS